jgi:formylglycine-generating enzyme required for sulfatase activity
MRHRFFDTSVLALLALASSVMTPTRASAQGTVIPAAQQQSATPTPLAEGMALIPGATLEMGIDASEVPRFQKFFHVDGMELFEPEIPRHRVIVASFFMASAWSPTRSSKRS